MNNNLTPKEELFCKEYILDFNGTQSAIRANYSKRTANRIASAMLKKEYIQKRILELTKSNGEKYDTTLDQCVAQLRRWVWQDVRKYLNEDGTHKKISDLDDDAAAAIAGFEVDETYETVDGEKRTAGRTKKTKRQDAVKAMEILVKVLGYMAPIRSDIKVTTPLNPEQVKELISSLKVNKPA